MFPLIVQLVNIGLELLQDKPPPPQVSTDELDDADETVFSLIVQFVSIGLE